MEDYELNLEVIHSMTHPRRFKILNTILKKIEFQSLTDLKHILGYDYKTLRMYLIELQSHRLIQPQIGMRMRKTKPIRTKVFSLTNLGLYYLNSINNVLGECPSPASVEFYPISESTYKSSSS